MAGHGSKPGERRGGRQKGTPNKATAEVRSLARQFGPEAVEKLVKLMRGQDQRIDRLIGKLIDSPPDDKTARKTMYQLVAKLEERNVQNELGAVKELLDRAYGKAPQALTGEDGQGPVKFLIEKTIVDAGRAANGHDTAGDSPRLRSS